MINTVPSYGGISIRQLAAVVILMLLAVVHTGCIGSRVGRGYYQVGYASWYGRDYHGKETANGEKFNMRAMTAAHRTLPFDTRVRVTDLQTGRSVVVRINDRGPFKRGRIIDLSHGAARRLGIVEKGVVQVGLQIL